jgi:Aminoglycoside-2''-adenylyltransferase
VAADAGIALDDDAWEPWHPAEAARRLAGVDAPWCVAAGWAIDLFLGGQRREHEDLEIAVPADRFDEIVQALDGLDFYVPGRVDGESRFWPLANAGGMLESRHQTWALDPAAGCWRLDVFREPADGATWVCRRDESIRLPYSRVIEHTDDGIPYARPEIVLLFKAKHAHQAKNAADFADTLPRLDAHRLAWLREGLGRCHPGHAWLEDLDRHAEGSP